MTILARLKLSYALYKRRKQRKLAGPRVSAGISAARKRAWRNDPLRVQT
jgi:hypothetical protein